MIVCLVHERKNETKKRSTPALVPRQKKMYHETLAQVATLGMVKLEISMKDTIYVSFNQPNEKTLERRLT